MGGLAVILAMFTVLVGMLALGALATPSGPSTLRSLVTGHLVCAFSGIVLLLIAVVGASRNLALASFGVLFGTGLLGLSVLLRSRTTPRPPPGPEEDPDRNVGTVPGAVVVLHGAAAVLTILVAFLAAIGMAHS